MGLCKSRNHKIKSCNHEETHRGDNLFILQVARPQSAPFREPDTESCVKERLSEIQEKGGFVTSGNNYKGDIHGKKGAHQSTRRLKFIRKGIPGKNQENGIAENKWQKSLRQKQMHTRRCGACSPGIAGENQKLLHKADNNAGHTADCKRRHERFPAVTAVGGAENQQHQRNA